MIRSCKEVTRMVSRGEDRELSFGERVALRVHLAYCRGCRNMRRQLVFLRRAVRRLAADDVVPAKAGTHT